MSNQDKLDHQFGEWSLLANWLVLIEARTHPGPGFAVTDCRVAPSGKGWRHSRIYDDEHAIRTIESWLDQTHRHERER